MGDRMHVTEKKHRQNVIREVLQTGSGNTQEEIKEYLGRQGIKASQSTLSRDLREIGAVKLHVNGGRACYKLGSPLDVLSKTVASFPVSFEAVNNLLIIKTAPGNAPGFCVMLDGERWSEIAGTIAGDDTVLVITRSPDDVQSVISKLEKKL